MAVGAAATISMAVWPVLGSIALGAAIWGWMNLDRLPDAMGNKLKGYEQDGALVSLVAGVAVVAAGLGLSAWVLRLQRGHWHWAEATRRWSKLMPICVSLPFGIGLALPGIESKHGVLTLALILLVTLLLSPIWSQLPDRPAAFSGKSLRWLAPATVLVLWAAYGAFFSSFSVTNHHALNTRAFDLGIYDNIFFQSSHGRPLDCTLIKAGNHRSAHFDPLLVLLSPLYYLYPRAEMLLVLQSVWLGHGVVPAYLIGRDRLGSQLAGLVTAAAYALSPALHGANMYDFHSLSLSAPLLLWLLYALEREAVWHYALALVALLLCREDLPLLLCFVSAYAIATRRPMLVRLGWTTIVFSLTYFALVKGLIMTAGKEGYSYSDYYAALAPNEDGVSEIVGTLLTNPAFVVKHMLQERKLVFFAVILLPLMGFPLFARPGRLMLLYGALFCGLASRPALYSIGFQYATVFYPVAIALMPEGIRQLSTSPWVERMPGGVPRFVRVALGSVLVAAALASWKFGGVLENTVFRGGYQRVTRTLDQNQAERYEWLERVIAGIPPEARVSVGMVTGAHASSRRYVFAQSDNKVSDFLLIHLKSLKGKRLALLKKRVKAGALVKVQRRGKYVLYKVASEDGRPF